jgi:AmmeMemoRadiSam system protein A
MKRFYLLAICLTLGIGLLTGPGVLSGWGGQAGMNLSTADQQLLLKVARDSIAAHLQGREPVPVKTSAPVLREPRGAFVSLHRHGQLRGCIGYIEAIKPLLQAVQQMAVAAAFQDPRFRPLQADELPDLEIEISVLSPLKLIKSTDEIEVGRDGLYIIRGMYRGLLLPQVATEYHWDRRTFLEQTCRKACLPPDAWQEPGTQIYTFTAQIFAYHPR